MIQLYLANQLFNIAVQRTVHNRQVTLMRGMAMLQSYYHGRRIGRGSLAFAERERAKARRIATKDKEKKEKAGQKEEVPTSVDKTSTTTETATTRTSSTTQEAPQEEEEEPPLRQCMQEAEYNFARGFHQMGMNQQAMLHYRRVLELPSWREVEQQQVQEAKQRRRALREVRRMESAEIRDARVQMQLQRKEEIRARKATRAKKEEMAKEKEEEDGASGGGEINVEDEEEDDEDDFEDEEDLDDESTDEDDDEEEDGRDSKRSKPSDGRIQLADDSTDLKREAAFNLAKIYMQSGAVGQARLLIHKYCTI